MSETFHRLSGDDGQDRYFLVLGAAAADLWSSLPQELEHNLFECAVVLGHKSERDESLREQLVLHDHNIRTHHTQGDGGDAPLVIE